MQFAHEQTMPGESRWRIGDLTYFRCPSSQLLMLAASRAASARPRTPSLARIGARVRFREIDDLQDLGTSELIETRCPHRFAPAVVMVFSSSMSFFFPRVLGQQEYEGEGGRQGDEADP
jgi:hypothetical protein